MYVRWGQRCTVPNSETPVSSADIERSVLIQNQQQTRMDSAQQAFDSVVQRNDLNGYGIPSPSGSAPDAWGALSGPPGSLADWPSSGCMISAPPPVLVPADDPKSFQALPVPPMPSLVTLPLPSPARLPRKPSGDVCKDLRDGLLFQSQVPIEQVYACSAAGPQNWGASGSDAATVSSYLNSGMNGVERAKRVRYARAIEGLRGLGRYK